jgi:hypothetical protein
MYVFLDYKYVLIYYKYIDFVYYYSTCTQLSFYYKYVLLGT